MARYWVVRAGDEIQELVERDSFVGISYGWTEDLTDLSREEIRDKLEQYWPDAHPSQRNVTAGQLYRFASDIDKDDVVLTPIKATRRVLFGKVAGPYGFNPNAQLDHGRHTREVEWARTDVSRSDLSTGLRNTLGGLMTVFNLDGHADEIERVIGGKVEKPEDPEDEQSDAEHADQVESEARERISDLLYTKFDDYEFEELVAAVLTAMGYRTWGRYKPGADGGVDIVATKDPLWLDPKRIKVQVKHKGGTAGRPEVQQLRGTLSSESERGLFVSLGGFSNEARQQNIPGVRLMDGDAFIDLLLEHYERLGDQVQARLPLKRVYLPAGEQ